MANLAWTEAALRLDQEGDRRALPQRGQPLF